MENNCDPNEVTLFMFSSSTCPPCKVIKPRVEKTCEELGLIMEYIDVREDPDLYRDNVMRGVWPKVRATPTFFIRTLDTWVMLQDFTIVTNTSNLCEAILNIRQELKFPGLSNPNTSINLN